MSLKVEHGSCCVVMGRSGAGKSTLLRAIAGLVRHAGVVEVDGNDLGGRPPHHRHLGMLFQDARLFPTMCALDNVAYPLRVRGVRRRARRESAAALLDQVGLGDRGAAWRPELSGGERQRVALARALCSQPSVLLLDEPFTGLDVPQRRGLVELLGSLRRERGDTWMIVSHDPDDALRLADTIAVLDQGVLVQHGETAEVRARPAGPVVTALMANPNVLTGHVLGACLTLGEARLPWEAADGGITLTVRPERVRLTDGGDGSVARHDTIVLSMKVTSIEHLSTGSVAVLDGAAGHLEVPCAGRTPALGVRADVLLHSSDLWQLDR